MKSYLRLEAGPAIGLTIALSGLSAIVSHTLSRHTLPVLETAMSDDLGLDEQRAGFLSAAIFFSYLFGVATMTVISGAVAPRRTLLAGLASSGFGFVVLGLAPGFTTLMLGFVFCGLGSAGIWLSVPTIATANTPPARRGMVMGSMSASMGVGLVTLSQLVRFARSDDEGIWRPIWVGAAIYTAAVIVLVAALMPRDTTVAVKNRLNLANLRLVPGWGALTFAYVLHGLIVSNFTLYLGSKLEADGFARSHITNLFSLLGLAALGAIGLGRLSDRVGRRAVLLISMVAMAGASGLILMGREPWVAVGVITYGMASFAYPVVITAKVRDHVSDRDFSNALGALTLIYGVALFVGPLIAGPVADSSLGFDALYLGLIGLAVVSALTLFAIPSRPETPASSHAR